MISNTCHNFTFVAGVFNNTTKREGKIKDKLSSVTMGYDAFQDVIPHESE